jgi:hypothetical protein
VSVRAEDFYGPKCQRKLSHAFFSHFGPQTTRDAPLTLALTVTGH